MDRDRSGRRRQRGAGTIVLGVTADISLILMRGFPQYLRDAGWDVHVVSTPGPLLDEIRHIRGVHSHGLVMNRQPSPGADMRALFAWIRLLRDVRPDVVSVGTPKAGVLGMLAAWMLRVPRRLYLLRGLRLETSTGAERRVLAALERLSMRCATDVVSVSESLRERALELRLVRPERIRVLGSGSSNGVDLVAADRVDTGQVDELRARLGIREDDEAPVIGFVGRLTEDKGIDVLASARLLLTERNVPHRLLIVGSVDEVRSEEPLMALRNTGSPPIETGQVADVRPYYRLMDILCLPTLREGFPNVVLEAAAAGLPTVTTDATGARDSVVDGVTGLICKAGDAASLADRLSELLSAEPAHRRSMGEQARARAESEFAQPDVWAMMEEHLRHGRVP